MLACFRDVNIYTNASLQTVRCTFKLILDSLAPLRPVQPPQKKKERERKAGKGHETGQTEKKEPETAVPRNSPEMWKPTLSGKVGKREKEKVWEIGLAMRQDRTGTGLALH